MSGVASAAGVAAGAVSGWDNQLQADRVKAMIPRLASRKMEDFTVIYNSLRAVKLMA